MRARAILTCIVAAALLVGGCKEWRSAGTPSQSPVTAEKILDVPELYPVVSAVALSTDGTLVAVGDIDGAIVLREVPSGAERWRNHMPYSGQVDRLAFSADGSLLGAIKYASSVSLWQVSTGQYLAGVGLGVGTRSIAFHPTDATLAAGAGQSLHFLTVGNVEHPKYLVNVFPGERIDEVAFSSDGHLLVAVSGQGTVKAWNWPELTPSTSLNLPKSIEAIDPVSLVLGGRNTRAAVNGRRGLVHVMDFVKRREERTFDNTPTAPGRDTRPEMRGSLAFSQDGNWLFAPDVHDRGLRILDLTSGRTYPVFRGDTPYYTAMSISVPASLVAVIRPSDVPARGPYGLEVWRLTYRTP